MRNSFNVKENKINKDINKNINYKKRIVREKLKYFGYLKYCSR